MKKKLMALALVSAMVLGLTACGGGASSSAPAGDAGTGEAAAPAAGGTKARRRQNRPRDRPPRHPADSKDGDLSDLLHGRGAGQRGLQ